MKTLTCLLIFGTFLVFCQSYQYIIPANLANKGKYYCNYENIGSIKKGESKQLKGTCQIANCNHDGSITVQGCGVVNGPRGCIVTPGDLSKPYPVCCYINICKK